MSDLPESRQVVRAGDSRGRRRVVWIALVIVLLFVAAVAWVGVRAYLAKRDLEASVSLVTQLKHDVSSGDGTRAQQLAKELEQRAGGARSLTSDPIWRTFEYTPLIGGNLRVVRQVAGIVDDVASNAVQPIAPVLSSFNTSSLRPVDGRVDLAPLERAQAPVARAATTLQRAQRDAEAIDTADTVSPVESAVNQLRSTLQSVAGEAGVANRAVQLAPSMLGAHGSKQYLLLFENNAELRAGGGISGAIALLRADNGSISLEGQASSSDFTKAPSPVLPLPVETQGLYGSITGEYIQDVTLTPRFSSSSKLARAMWKQKYGQDVDGVLSIDPVTLSYILKATGPVTLPTGDTLTSSNAVSLLLSEVYARYPDNAEQDAFFAGAAADVFAKVSSGRFDPSSLVSALAKGAGEGRLKLWSADPAEQLILAPTAISGSLPRSSASTAKFGVYLNDATGAKMDYYLTKQIAVGSKVCRADGRPTWTVQVTLKNTAPADAATSLPRYVTGGGGFGVSPGNVGTNVAIYAPRTGVFLSASQDGKAASPQTALDGTYPVVQIPTLLSPGQSTTLTVQFLGPKAAAGHTVAAESTPGVHQTVTRPVDVTCESR
ncbi:MULTISPECIES: DUF4012 domain-containing protein [unclassified Curtobacterium]|uniref:DUF4012 domain-containing protein n=1 Tax=unclassified Curtobacterium TaxID=257496 RepID=UPI000DA97F91|nr:MULTISPECIES: DUF4012 domain-containing protein [unclassified Curtobacterium]PZE78336.1 hypothetical protein DEI82_00720 [Curtobacterium sp. MCBD17_019]WIE55172.1 DUF4012 domain-containing protein [Curtobacterium sp. MCBD17_003]